VPQPLALDSVRWYRRLDSNQFSGSMPSTISAMTALTFLYVPPAHRFGVLFAVPPWIYAQNRSGLPLFALWL
jgi:hypothetical protein